MSGSETEFSSNAHSSPKPLTVTSEFEVPTRHADLSFSDGNLVILTGHRYFIVHRTVVSCHSEVLKHMVDFLPKTCKSLLENHPVLPLPHSPEDMFYFLNTLYG